MRGQCVGFTRREMVVCVFVACLVVGMVLLWLVASGRHEDRRMHCRGNLLLLSKCMSIYIAEHGDNRFLPCPLGRGRSPGDYTGAEWLAGLHWAGEPDLAGVLLCPSSGDTNDGGRDLGRTSVVGGRFGPRTVSYAGLHYYSTIDGKGVPQAGPITIDFPSGEPVASDDTEATVNHAGRWFAQGGMTVLFFDSHVEFFTDDKLDPTDAVGNKGGLLWRLRN